MAYKWAYLKEDSKLVEAFVEFSQEYIFVDALFYYFLGTLHVLDEHTVASSQLLLAVYFHSLLVYYNDNGIMLSQPNSY